MTLATEWHNGLAAVRANPEEEDGGPIYKAWIETETKLTATRATTMAGAIAGLRIARREIAEHYEGDHEGDFVSALVASAVAVLEREVARG